MRILAYGFLSAIALICAFSCTQKKDTSLADAARALYEKSVALSNLYTDSMKNAKDSATVLRLSEEFEEALTNLNFKYPADADIEMSEGENDTLANLNLSFAHLRDSLLYRIAHPLVLAADSVASDSTAVPADNADMDTQTTSRKAGARGQ